MDFHVKVYEQEQYIHMIVNTDIDMQVATRLAQELSSVSGKTQIYNYLVDVRGVRNTISIIDNYEFGYRDMPKLGISYKSRAAILVSPGDSSHDMVETFTQNAGYVNMLFTDENAAMQWLVPELVKAPLFAAEHNNTVFKEKDNLSHR